MYLLVRLRPATETSHRSFGPRKVTLRSALTKPFWAASARRLRVSGNFELNWLLLSTIAAGPFIAATNSYSPAPENSYADESVKGFEGGVKARLLDRRMAVNLAAYDYKYANLQVGAVLPAPIGSIPITQTVNAASAKIYGVDFDVTCLAFPFPQFSSFAPPLRCRRLP